MYKIHKSTRVLARTVAGQLDQFARMWLVSLIHLANGLLRCSSPSQKHNHPILRIHLCLKTCWLDSSLQMLSQCTPTLRLKKLSRRSVIILQWTKGSIAISTLKQLVRHCIWCLISGTAMGTPPAPAWATIFYALHENKMVPRWSQNLMFYKRFIDDVIGIWLTDPEQ